MQSFYIFCLLPFFLGTTSAVVNLGDDHVIFQKPQDVLAPPEHDDSDHDHHEDEFIHEVANNATDLNTTLAVDLGNVTEVMDNSTYEFEDYDEDHTTVGPEMDGNGCQMRLRNEMERRCFSKFEDIVALSLHNDDVAASEKEVCCALEEYEKCCYHGYKVTNCNTDKDSLKETLKAARIFLGAITKNSCSAHRGQCAFSSAGNIGMSVLMTCSAVLASLIAFV